MSDLYKSIKDVCEARGTTVSAMCLAIGKSKSLMSDLKSGRKKSLSSDVLQLIADHLHVSVESLLGREESKYLFDDDELSELRQALRERPDLKMLFDAGLKATPQTVRQTAQFLEGLAKSENPD